MKEFQEETTFLPEKIDPIDRNEFSKESLEQIINSRISPRIIGVNITPITIGDAKDNKVVYVVDIPKSDTAHQASDKRYYRRFNFQSIAMDDWEIKDIFNRKSKAEIKISLIPDMRSHIFDRVIKSSGIPIECDIIATNTGNKVVEYVDCMILGSDVVANEITPKPQVINGRFEIYHTNQEMFKVTLKGDEFVVNSKRMAILPKTYRVIGKITFFF